MHPFYDPSAELLADRRTVPTGVWSMAAYLAFWAVAIPAAIAMLRRALVDRPETAGDPARRILRERYARGEIDTEEFRRRAEALDEP